MSTFEIRGDDFTLNGKPFTVLSGALHYFRVPKEYWADRIAKARLMGLNTIETYVPWNLHEPEEGRWVTEGNLDLGEFLDQVAAAGMHAFVRPGPFICAEFTGGGLPPWLLESGRTKVRQSDPRFVEATLNYLTQVYRIVAPRQIDEGGPVILVQIENEYGAYGDDQAYLQQLVDHTLASGITVPLTTIDQPRPDQMPRGLVPGTLATGSFGSRATSRLEYLRSIQPTGPLMCAEFWDGWFDQWGEHHHVTSAAESAAELDELLSHGASVNFYMFHGGTNFGFLNGANDKGLYKPIVTSYDYDAPLSEDGQFTEKFWAFREVIGKYQELPEMPAEQIRPQTSPAVTRVGTAPLAHFEEATTEHAELPSFDDLAHYYGYGLYRTEAGNEEEAVLSFADVRDRAIVFADRVRVGTLDRMDGTTKVAIPAGTQRLTLLVEDQGRVNYGPRIGEAKGLIGPALLDGRPLTNWETTPLHFQELSADQIEELRQAAQTDAPTSGPAFHVFEAQLDEPADLYLDTTGWGKGLVWVNGTLLGRYWERGPQKTLYVPAPFVTAGKNSVIYFETEPVLEPHCTFTQRLNLGPIDW